MTKLVAATIIRNEADRYLTRFLDHLDTYCDEIIILDDHSDDDTIEICKSYDKAEVYESEKPMFTTAEYLVKDMLWKNILPRHLHIGDWVLTIDADEFIEQGFIDNREKFFAHKRFNMVMLTILELWGSEDMVRVDSSWTPLGKQTPMFSRWLPQVNYIFPPLKMHCGRAPVNQPGEILYSSYHMVHFGYAAPEAIQKKAVWYKEHDPNPDPVMKKHYETMVTKPVCMPLKQFIR